MTAKLKPSDDPNVLSKVAPSAPPTNFEKWRNGLTVEAAMEIFCDGSQKCGSCPAREQDDIRLTDCERCFASWANAKAPHEAFFIGNDS